jgi:3-methyladenine DNA glycosylase/8-oxoguanine DNA glycosylase
VDLPRTLAPLRRGTHDPAYRVQDGAHWLALRTPLGAASLCLRSAGSAVLSAAWGPGAEWATGSIPGLLGADDDDRGFEADRHPVIAAAHRRTRGLRLTRTGLVFDMLLPAILEQKITGLEAHRSWRWLLARHGQPAPGPAPEGMRVTPGPETVRRVPSWEWHRAGVGPERSAAIARAATLAASLERATAAGGDAAERALRSIPGIGVWTAAETLQRSHGDPDRVSVGDYHVPSLVGRALTGRAVGDDGMLELLQPWAGHRQRVVRLIEALGRGPRFGPRITLQDHRAH